MSISVWIKAARLRTLPLAISGAITGNLMAMAEKSEINLLTFFLSVFTAIFLQILSNYANDYGDFMNGVDTHERSDRMMASGQISEANMKRAIQFLIVLSVLLGIFLLLQSLGSLNFIFFILFFLGISGILAAYYYTIGKNPYGYIGLGDTAVFLFFGLLSVIGTYFLQTKTIDTSTWWIACAVGFLSSSVLNINNIRDIETDQQKNKKTIPVMLGFQKALRYHLFLLVSAVLCFGLYVYLNFTHPLQLIYLIFIPILIKNYANLKKAHSSGRPAYNRQLKSMSMLTLLISLIFCFSQLLVK